MTDRDQKTGAPDDPALPPHRDAASDGVTSRSDQGVVPAAAAPGDPRVATGVDSPVEGSATPGDETPSARGRQTRVIAWAAMIAALAVFIAVGSVPVNRDGENAPRLGDPTRSRDRLLHIWEVQVANLPDVANDTLLAVAFLAAILLFLLAGGVALWYALVPAETEMLPGDDAASSPPDRSEPVTP